MIPETTIEAVRERVKLEDVVRETVELKRSGRSLMGRCPFHDDGTPSLSVTATGWRCFGCDRSGDVFAWIQERDGIDFPAAVRLLGGDMVDTADPGPRRGSKSSPRRESRPKPPAPAPPSADPDLLLAVLVRSKLGPQGRGFLRLRGLEPDAAEGYGMRSIEEPAEWATVRGELAAWWGEDALRASGLDPGPWGWRRPVLILPFYGLNLSMDALRFRNVTDGAAGGDRYRDLGGHRPSVPFLAGRGLRMLRPGADLHVTEGELDGWTLHSAHDLPHVIALPGASFPWHGEWTRHVQRAGRVYLWADGDPAGDGAVAGFARTMATALGPDWVRERCRRLPLPEGQDVNDLHRSGALVEYVAGCAAA